MDDEPDSVIRDLLWRAAYGFPLPPRPPGWRPVLTYLPRPLGGQERLSDD